jgi:hypothetical protein
MNTKESNSAEPVKLSSLSLEFEAKVKSTAKLEQ